MKFFLTYVLLLTISSLFGQYLPFDSTQWQMTWNDEFDYPDSQLDEKWESQNGPSGHILCSRWRENAVVKEGVLELQARKENRGGQEWTAGNIWTKKHFQYGYFECRYKYAAASGTNNSFWFMTRGDEPNIGKRFEIDINEGHFPNEINTNLHNWSDKDENGNHPNDQRAVALGVKHDYQIELNNSIKTTRLRFSSNNSTHFHIREFRAFGPYNGNYPNIMSETADTDIPGLVNYVRESGTTISVSGVLRDEFNKERLADGKILATSWVSQPEGEKWIEFEFYREKEIQCIQFINGWKKGDDWLALISDYKIEYHNGNEWVTIEEFDVKQSFNLAENYHTYGLLWTETELKYYFDGEVIRTLPNDFCFSPAPIWLSLAVLEYAGEVTDAIDGTSMVVDYVRVYEKKTPAKNIKQSMRPPIPYPNPTKQVLNFKNIQKGTELIIFNQTGQQVKKTLLGKNTPIDVASLTSGIYHYKIIDNQTQLFGKFIKL